jgi:DNA-3-methyladenine glycosylase II
MTALSVGLVHRSFPVDAAPPFHLGFTAWALRRRSENAVDLWDGTTYRRALALREAPVELAVTQGDGGGDAPQLTVALVGRQLSGPVEESVKANIEHILGLRVDLSAFYGLAEADGVLDRLVVRFRGVKPPRFPTVFEGLINAIACQQLSLESGLSLLNRLAATYGGAVSRDRSIRAFPGPDDLAGLEPQAFRDLGFSLRKAASITELSRSLVDGRLNLDDLDRLADDEVVSRLTSVRGIGRWSAEYVMLRGLGRLHVFPGDDVGARNKLARVLGVEPPLGYDSVKQAVSRWEPYAGMVYFHLLLDGLEAAGALEDMHRWHAARVRDAEGGSKYNVERVQSPSHPRERTGNDGKR